MTATNPAKTTQPPLLDSILQYGKLAFDPELPEETRQLNQPKFTGLLERYSKFCIYLVYTKAL
jgi:hypothetical protein